MNYADLPGQAFVLNSTPIDGMTFDIINCSTTTFLATAAATTTLSSSTHRRVRYNGSSAVWQVVG